MTVDATLTLAEATAETPTPYRSQEDQVAALLREVASPPRPEPETVPTDAPAQPETAWDLKTVAEKLGADPAKLYEGLKVSMADGEELTVSALKDAYRPVAELEKARGKLLEDMEGSKREVVQTQQEVAALLQLLGPQNLKPEVLAEVGRRTEQQRQTEAERLLKAIPDWKDPIAKAADWSDIRKVAPKYGFSDAEVRLAEAGYADHRMVALLRDAARTPRPEQPKPEPRKGMAPQKAKQPGVGPSVRDLKAAVRNRNMSEAEAVTSLLKGAKVI